MNKEILKFKQTHGVNLPIIVRHLMKIGVDRAAKLTDKDIAEIINKIKNDEEASEKEGKILLISAEYQGYIIGACRDLALLLQSEDDSIGTDAEILIAQSLVSEQEMLKHMEAARIEKEYWTRTIQEYVECLADEEEQQECQEIIDDEDKMYSLIMDVSGDEDVIHAAEESIAYYIKRQ